MAETVKHTPVEECSIPGCGKPRRARGYCLAHYGRFYRNGHPLGGRTPEGEPLRFVYEVALNHTGDECLIWPYSKSNHGYGKLRIDGKMVHASRYICELIHGSPPTPDYEAAHSCGKGHEGCVAPGHLDWKTRIANMADKLVHGTHIRGEQCAAAKLSEPEAREIIKLKGEEPKSQLAKRFGVSLATIANIHAGRAWAWISEEVPQ